MVDKRCVSCLKGFCTTLTYSSVRSSLHERVVDHMPSHERKPKTVMAAIMKAGKSTLGELGSENFLWIKCKSVSSLQIKLRLFLSLPQPSMQSQSDASTSTLVKNSIADLTSYLQEILDSWHSRADHFSRILVLKEFINNTRLEERRVDAGLLHIKDKS